ncbi:MAG TPA: hypothetical protein VN867_03485, partial [Candidatus Binataceae bacterium]|nr:hypothetical protein [Candidatus Binataceae bacterium]
GLAKKPIADLNLDRIDEHRRACIRRWWARGKRIRLGTATEATGEHRQYCETQKSRLHNVMQ